MRLISVHPTLFNTSLFRESVADGALFYTISSPGSGNRTIVSKSIARDDGKAYSDEVKTETVIAVFWNAAERKMKVEYDGRVVNGEELFSLSFAGEWRFKTPTGADYIWESLKKGEWQLVRPLKHGESSRLKAAHWHRLSGIRAFMKKNAYLEVNRSVEKHDLDYIVATLVYLARRDAQKASVEEYSSDSPNPGPSSQPRGSDIAPGTGLGFYDSRGEGHHVDAEAESREEGSREIEHAVDGDDGDSGSNGDDGDDGGD